MRVQVLTSRLREPFHLVARFVDVLFSRRLSPSEQLEVADLLDSAGEHAMYWDQPRADQRHGLQAARYVLGVRPGRRDLARAALLHDTGKRHARLGVVARSVAGLVRLVGGRGRGRIAAYLEHGAVAGEELAALGVDPLISAYATHHHGRRPASIREDEWQVLAAADRVRR